MYLDVDTRALARRRVFDLRDWLDWHLSPSLIPVSRLAVRAGSDVPGSPRSTHKPKPPKSKEPLDDVQTVFLHFIATGVLPAAHGGHTLDSLQRYLTEQLHKDPHFFGAPSGGSVFSHRLLDLLLENRIALPRLLTQFGESLLEDIYAHTMESGIVSRWIAWLSEVPGLDTRTLRWRALLLSLSYTGGRISLDNYAKVEKGIVLYLLREMQPAQLFRWVGQLPPLKREKLVTALDIPPAAFVELSDLLAVIHEQTAQLQTPAMPPPAPALLESGYVDNAGLVLLHPFLFPLFQELGWVDGMGFVSESAHQHAVLLCEYLAGPADVTPEYRLPLNKLLCGYPLESTLPVHLDDDHSPLTAERLLQSLIRQWTVNGQPVNANIQLLRDSWLNRRGKLIRRERDWVLQVEQKAFDVLLNSLAWNIRMVQLPWMKEVLWVEWV